MQAALGLIGLLGLVLLVVSLCGRPWLRSGLLAVVVWQSFWYLLRAVLMVGIWRREPGLSPGEKLWMALTVPIYILFGVWCYRGRLSAWLAAEKGDGA